jgi:hypothetical protein
MQVLHLFLDETSMVDETKTTPGQTDTKTRTRRATLAVQPAMPASATPHISGSPKRRRVSFLGGLTHIKRQSPSAAKDSRRRGGLPSSRSENWLGELAESDDRFGRNPSPKTALAAAADYDELTAPNDNNDGHVEEDTSPLALTSTKQRKKSFIQHCLESVAESDAEKALSPVEDKTTR